MLGMDKRTKSEGRASQNEQISPAMEQALPSLPLEVIQELLEISSDLQLVKTCRLVCRSWNQIASRVLKRISAVRIDERDESSLDEFKQLLADCRLSMPPEWPNPFKNYKVVGNSFTSPRFLRCVQLPSIRVTSLEIIHKGSINSEALKDLLSSPKNRIWNLVIRGESIKAFPKAPVAGLKWLRRLELTDSCVNEDGCSHVKLFRNLAKPNQVRDLQFSGYIENLLRGFFIRSTVRTGSNLETLACSFDKLANQRFLNNRCLRLFEYILNPILRRIEILFPLNQPEYPTREEVRMFLLPLIRRCSNTLEVLNISKLCPERLPFCPKLKLLKLSLWGAETLGSVPEANLPSLTTIHLSSYLTESPTYVPPADNSSQNSVVTCAEVYLSDAGSIPNHTIWPTLAHRFPKLNQLRVLSKVESAGTFQAIVRLFAKLESLHLEEIEEEILLGVPIQALMAKGWPYEQVRGTSLLDLTKIRELSLGKPAFVTLNIITLCFLKLPELTTVEFHWNDALCPSDVLDNLGHLDEIRIHYTDPKYEESLEQLANDLPSVKLLQEKKGSEIQGF